MISNYAELTQALYKWMVRDSNDPFFDATMMDNIISLAEKELNRRLRVRQMLDTVTLSIGSGDNTTALPTGFLEVMNLYLNEPYYNLVPASPGVFDNKGFYNISGTPTVYYVNEDSFVWGPIPASNYTATLEFYKEIPALSSTQTTNDVLTRFPDLYLFTCLKHAYIAAQDVEREAAFEARIAALIMDCNSKNQKVTNAKNARGIAKRII